MRSKASIKGHPIHPILVGFPIAMWVGGFIFDLIGAKWPNPGLWAAGFYSVVAGCVWAVMAAAAGIIDWLFTVPPESSARQRGLIHGGLNALNLLLFIYVAYRLGSPSAAPDGITLFLMAIGVVILAVAGWLYLRLRIPPSGVKAYTRSIAVLPFTALSANRVIAAVRPR